MKENQSKVIKKSKRVWIIEGKKGTTCLVRSSNWYGEGRIGTVRLF